MKSYLVLENGNIFEGERIGYLADTICEVVFNTSMTGYLEIFTDPSYSGQGVVMTYPLIGNYGLTLEDKESRKPWIQAVFVHELAEMESNFRSKLPIDKFLKYNKIPGLQGVNTRKLTKILRDNGTMRGMLTDDISNIEEILNKIKNYHVSNVVQTVSSKTIYEVGKGNIQIGLLDFGSKQNIINSLVRRGCKVTVLPCNTSSKSILSKNFDVNFEQDLYEETIAAIETQAALYGETHTEIFNESPDVYMTVEELALANVIISSSEGVVKDPRDNEDTLNDLRVKITNNDDSVTAEVLN